MIRVKHKKRIKVEVLVRNATLDDVNGILDLEQETWPFFPANREKVESRIQTFPEGSFVVTLSNGEIVGYLSLQFINYDLENPKASSWDEMTDCGTIRKSHLIDGAYIFGVGMSVSPRYQNMGIATRLFFATWAIGVGYNRRGCMLGSRMPGYADVKDRYSPEQYVQLRREDGKLFDPELRLYEGDGFRLICLLPNYENDPPSCDYGVLVYQGNPFYNRGGRLFQRLAAWFLARWGHKIIGV